MLKKGPKIIIKKLEPTRKPSVITKQKIKDFISENIDNFSEIVYIGWVRRKYELSDGTSKRGLRFVAATAEKRLEARNIMKKSDNWGVDLWDLT